MPCFTHYRLRSAYLASGVDKLGLLEPCSALLALVAAGFRIATHRACPLHIPVGQKQPVFLTVKLLFGFFDQDLLPVEFEKKLLACLVMDGKSRPGIVVEAHPELFKALSVYFMIQIYDLLRTYPFFLCGYRDGNAVLIRPAYEDYVVASEAQVPDENIGRKVGARKVSEMNRTVRIRERRRNKCAGIFRWCVEFFRQ